MINLLEETLAELEDAGKTPGDVLWVGSLDGRYASSWEVFVRLADVDYSNGYGRAEVAEDLVVVFADGSWLARGEYDGSEWWDYHKVPTLRLFNKPLPGALTGRR